jgi:hypothetical protein
MLTKPHGVHAHHQGKNPYPGGKDARRRRKKTRRRTYETWEERERKERECLYR